jgi:hypothetical protein
MTTTRLTQEVGNSWARICDAYMYLYKAVISSLQLHALSLDRKDDSSYFGYLQRRKGDKFSNNQRI